MRKEKVQKFKKISVGLLLALVVLSTAFAAIIIQKQIPATLRVKQAFAWKIFDVDGTTELVTIGLGDFLWYDNFYYPGKIRDNMPSPPPETYFIENVDQVDFYIMFECLEGVYADTQMGFSIYVRRLDKSSFTELTHGGIYQFPLTSPTLDSDPAHDLWHAAEWYLHVFIGEPAFMDYSIDMTFSAVSTPSG